MPRSSKNSYRRLLRTASLQQGLFTSSQSREAGYSYAAAAYQIRVGNWIRRARGVYELADYPDTDRPDLVLWSLWSRNVAGVPQGVYSHQTAMAIHELSDLQPAKLHMSVPTSFRRRSSIPEILILHRQDIPAADVLEYEGYRVTRPMRTITDLLKSGAVHPEVLRHALNDALKSGQITRREHKEAHDKGLLDETTS